MCIAVGGGGGWWQDRERRAESGRCSLIAKTENVTTPSISAACLSCVEFTREAGKKNTKKAKNRSYARYV